MTEPETIVPAGVGQRIRSLEIDGFTILPRLLGTAQVEWLRTELEALPLDRSRYTDKQWFAHHVQWAECPSAWALVANPAALEFLADLFGDEVACMSVSYSRSDPAYPGM